VLAKKKYRFNLSISISRRKVDKVFINVSENACNGLILVTPFLGFQQVLILKI
jgi:hypothetical protein